MYGFRKKDFLYGGIITVIIVSIAFLLALIGLSTKVFDPIGLALDEFQLSDGFFYSNSTRRAPENDAIPDIVIVDIESCDSRAEITGIVEAINEADPKALAVDIIFGNHKSSSAQEDSALVAAFKESPCLILAQRNELEEDGWHIERSFFADEIQCLEGDVSFSPGMVRTFNSSIEVDGKQVPSFISLIADKAGLEESPGEKLINFSPVKTITLKPDLANAAELLKDQIVILGDSGDLRDFHNIPVLIKGRPRTSGTNLIAQCLYTLRPGKQFYTCPEWLSAIIGLILTYLFCAFIAAPLYRKEKFNGLWISIWQVAVLIILVIITYTLFWVFHFYMPLKYWLIGVGLSGFATELFYFIKPKICRL